MTDTLIHIGYHKTGTTLLQRRVFSNSRVGFPIVLDVDELCPAFAGVNGLAFEPDSMKARFTPRVEEATKDGLISAPSLERLSGAPHHGIYDSKAIADRTAAKR